MGSLNTLYGKGAKQEEEEMEKMGESLFFLTMIFLFSLLAITALFFFALAVIWLFVSEWKTASLFFFAASNLALFFAWRILRGLSRRAGRIEP